MTKNSSFDKLMNSLDGDDSAEPAAIGGTPESEADLGAPEAEPEPEADFEVSLDALEAEPEPEPEPEAKLEAKLEVTQEQPKVETKPKRATKRVAPPENITQPPATEPSTLTTKHAEPIDEFAGLSPQTRKEMELGRQRVEALQRR